MIKYSVIIPVKEINDYVRETIPKILEIKRNDYEIIIYPNIVSPESWPHTRQIATGRVGPGEKRSRALRDAQGEILVFFDDDSYPQIDYFDVLERAYQDAAVVAVGGPGITPPHDNFWQKVSGAVFLSTLAGGFPERYVPIGSKRSVDDWPSVNLTIKTEVFRFLGGFDCAFWPGEDTKLCQDLLLKTGSQVLYDPALIVYHHRRSGLRSHLRQIWGYGLHRGFFARILPQTSRKLKYFIPSAFLLFVGMGVPLVMGVPSLRNIYVVGWLFYGIAITKALLDIWRFEKNPLLLLNTLYYIFFTHLVYGAGFIKGLFSQRLKSTLR